MYGNDWEGLETSPLSIPRISWLTNSKGFFVISCGWTFCMVANLNPVEYLYKWVQFVCYADYCLYSYWLETCACVYLLRCGCWINVYCHVYSIFLDTILSWAAAHSNVVLNLTCTLWGSSTCMVDGCQWAVIDWNRQLSEILWLVLWVTKWNCCRYI